MGTQKSAAEKRMWAMNRIDENGLLSMGIKKEILIAEMCTRFYCMRNTAMEILKNFEGLRRIIIKNGVIYSTKFFDFDGEALTKQENDKPD